MYCEISDRGFLVQKTDRGLIFHITDGTEQARSIIGLLYG